MRSAEGKQEAEAIVADVLALLDNDRLAAEIDLPIERAFDSFEAEMEAPLTHDRFLRAVGKLVLHICDHAGIPLPFRRTMAVAEAVHILERLYQGTHANGYAAAYLDALDPQTGICLVLRRVAEILKTVERRRYLQWVFQTRITSRDWTARCQIVRVLQEKWGHVLPEQIRQARPAEFADDIPLLIQAVHTEANRIDQALSGRPTPRPA